MQIQTFETSFFRRRWMFFFFRWMFEEYEARHQQYVLSPSSKLSILATKNKIHVIVNHLDHQQQQHHHCRHGHHGELQLESGAFSWAHGLVKSLGANDFHLHCSTYTTKWCPALLCQKRSPQEVVYRKEPHVLSRSFQILPWHGRSIIIYPDVLSTKACNATFSSNITP